MPANFNFLLADHQRIDDDPRMAALRPHAARRQAVPAARRPRLPAGAGRRAGARLPDAARISASSCATIRPRPMRWRSAISPTGCAAAGRSRNTGRATSGSSRDERLELQQLLARHGYDVGEPDGRLGAKTRAAIRDFQARIGQVPDGFASAGVLDQLRGALKVNHAGHLRVDIFCALLTHAWTGEGRLRRAAFARSIKALGDRHVWQIAAFALADRGGRSGRGRVREPCRGRSGAHRPGAGASARRALSVPRPPARPRSRRLLRRPVRAVRTRHGHRARHSRQRRSRLFARAEPAQAGRECRAVMPTTTIVVMGDGMADWLAYGLEDAFSDSPEIAIVRKDKSAFRPAPLRIPRAISTGGTSRATSSRRRRPITWS